MSIPYLSIVLIVSSLLVYVLKRAFEISCGLWTFLKKFYFIANICFNFLSINITSELRRLSNFGNYLNLFVDLL